MRKLAQNREVIAKRKRGPGRPFPPGNRANPGGRPRSEISLTHILRRMMAEEADKRTKAEAIASKLVEMATKGDIRAISYVIDRLDGKAPETVNMGATTDALKLKEAQELARKQVALIREKAPELLQSFMATMGGSA